MAKCFLDDYKTYTGYYFQEFISFLETRNWYKSKKSNCITHGFVFKDNDLWKSSGRFLKDFLDFSKPHWISFLEIMKEQGYDSSTTSLNPMFQMSEIYKKESFKPWWKTRNDWIIQNEE